MLEDAGHKVGLIGTNQNLIGDEVVETERTTPCLLYTSIPDGAGQP